MKCAFLRPYFIAWRGGDGGLLSNRSERRSLLGGLNCRVKLGWHSQQYCPGEAIRMRETHESSGPPRELRLKRPYCRPSAAGPRPRSAYFIAASELQALWLPTPTPTSLANDSKFSKCPTLSTPHILCKSKVQLLIYIILAHIISSPNLSSGFPTFRVFRVFRGC